MPEISRYRFGQLVDDALDTLPDELLRLVDNVVIQIAERHVDEPGLLGIYEGVALTERGNDYTFSLPDTITIFRKAILDICDDEGEVAHEVAVTVVHEIGHHFGIEEARLHELGWG
jgi:predicted Zn-dependent protease with MMP-like domain